MLSARALLLVALLGSALACSSANGGADETPIKPGADSTPASDDTAPTDDGAVTPGDDTTPPDPSDTAPPPPPDDTGTAGGDTSVPPPPPIPGAVYGTKCTGMSAGETTAWAEIAVIRGKARMGALDCID